MISAFISLPRSGMESLLSAMIVQLYLDVDIVEMCAL